MGTSGLEQLLGVLEEEFSDFEQAQASDSDDGQVSGTEQGSCADAPLALFTLPQAKDHCCGIQLWYMHSILVEQRHTCC